MKTKSKALLLTLCAVLLVAASVLGTMAYLTDNDTVTNTFTVGKVEFGGDDDQKGLDEAKTNTDGQPLDKDGKVVTDVKDAVRVQANTYKLVPGHSYTKDPTVHVNKGSENCWVFVKVENGISAYEAATVKDGYTNIAGQITANGWTALNGVENVYYKEYTKDDTNVTNYVVFSNFKIADNADTVSGWDSINTTKPTIVINAYAVQKDGFDTAKAAWDATFGKSTTGTTTGDATGDDQTADGGVAGK